MNYQETLNYLFSLYPNIDQKGWGAYKPGLERVFELSKLTHHPQKKYPIIHIAGTNGKGSVSHFLAAALQQAGYTTGLFCSPHLVDFSERIKINGETIPQHEVINFVQKYDQAYQVVQPSFFEFTCMMALDYFAQQKVDIAIIETGMGGRLDCTNIVHPILSVITNIGWDHQKFLGNNLTAIALEKAGIIKKNIPVVIGKKQAETDRVFKATALNLNCSLHFAQDSTHEFPMEDYPSDLTGIYQTENKLTALVALKNIQQHFPKLSQKVIQQAFKQVVANTNFMGRWQIVSTNPKIIVDTAHNVDGMQQVVEQLNGEAQKITVVLGFAADKDVEDIIKLFPLNWEYIWTSCSNPRMLTAQNLAKKALRHNLKGKIIERIEDFISLDKNPQNTYFIGGSNYLVGDFLKEFLKSKA